MTIDRINPAAHGSFPRTPEIDPSPDGSTAAAQRGFSSVSQLSSNPPPASPGMSKAREVSDAPKLGATVERPVGQAPRNAPAGLEWKPVAQSRDPKFVVWELMKRSQPQPYNLERAQKALLAAVASIEASGAEHAAQEVSNIEVAPKGLLVTLSPSQPVHDFYEMAVRSQLERLFTREGYDGIQFALAIRPPNTESRSSAPPTEKSGMLSFGGQREPILQVAMEPPLEGLLNYRLQAANPSVARQLEELSKTMGGSQRPFRAVGVVKNENGSLPLLQVRELVARDFGRPQPPPPVTEEPPYFD